MPEPSREAREAAEAVTGSVSRWYYAKPARRVNMDTPRDTIARALDDFAEKRREEAEMWKRSAESQHGSVQEVTQERDALRRRVGELEVALDKYGGCRKYCADRAPKPCICGYREARRARGKA